MALKVVLALDLDAASLTGTVDGELALRRVAEGIGGSGQWVLEWVPDVAFESAALGYAAEGFAALATSGSVAAPAEQASLLLAGAALDTEKPAWAVAIDLAAVVDLGTIPVIGHLLAGTSVGPLGVRYSTAAIPAGSLPPPAPAGTAIEAGVSLEVTIAAAGTTYPLSYGAPAPAATTTTALAADPPPDPGAAGLQWFDVGRTFGPLAVQRIGIEADDRQLGLGFDASLTLAVLSIALTGFQITFPKADPEHFTIGIEGLAVSIRSSALSIQGGLIHHPATKTAADSYDGSLVIEAEGFGVTAVGSFTEVDGAPSLFVFGMASGQFGGPPAFFVTGLAAGFGYNRALNLPAPEQVTQFPLVELISQGSLDQPPDTAKVLEQLGEGGWIPPQKGEYWVAAGIQATSFELLHSAALLMVEFGSELVFALLGTSEIQLPGGGGPVYAQATLEIDAVLRPAEGTFQLTALLTPDSFVLDPACKLTGGFAFWLWFGDNPHSGDFVVTLGGYNASAFSPPAWYPSIPRLGFDWKMSTEIELSGDAYFALTPACVMAGGGLSLKFAAGGLRAWFDAQADFVIWWKPFHYDVYVGVSIGASYSTRVLGVQTTFSISLGANVHLWGPQLAGVAHVHWFVISFTIAINGGGDPPPPVLVLKDWPAFATAFMPGTAVCGARPAGGLLGKIGSGADEVWVMNPHGFALAVQSSIPASEISIAGPSQAGPVIAGPAVGVYPLAVPAGSAHFTSPLGVELVSVSSGKTVDLSGWTWAPAVSGVPQALWGIANDGTPPAGAATTPGLLGAAGTPVAPAPQGPGRFDVALLAYEDALLALPLAAGAPVDGAVAQPGGDTREVVAATIATTAAPAREALVDALNAAYGGGALAAGPLGTFAAKTDTALQAGPRIGPAGTSGGPPVDERAPVLPERATVAAGRAPTALDGQGEADQRPPRGTDPQAARPVARFRRSAPTAGAPRLRAHVADHAASVHERELAGTEALAPGGTVVFAVDPAAPPPAVHANPPVPLRITALDAAGHLLADGPLEAVPEGAAVVAVSRPAEPPGGMAGSGDGEASTPPGGMAGSGDGEASTPPGGRAEGRDATAGWDGDAPLVQIGPFALLGDGCVVRGQAPHRLPSRPRRRTRAIGATTGRALAERGWTEGPDGPERGFVETTLPAWTRAVAVRLRPDPATAAGGAPPAPEVRLRAGPPLAPAAAGGAEFTYALPETGRPPSVLVRAGAGWIVDGVIGSGDADAGPAARAAGTDVLVTLR